MRANASRVLTRSREEFNTCKRVFLLTDLVGCVTKKLVAMASSFLSPSHTKTVVICLLEALGKDEWENIINVKFILLAGYLKATWCINDSR